MSTTDDARAEAERRVRENEGLNYDMEVDAFALGAEWQASRKVEAAPSDTDHKAIVHVLFDLMPDTWDEGDIGILADAILEDGLSRSQPVQVEITDEMIERGARAIFADEQCDRRQKATPESLDENWHGRLSERDQAEYHSLARAALSAALGGEANE